MRKLSIMKPGWLNRYYENTDEKLLQKGKVFVLMGPRRVGKTEFIKRLISRFDGKVFSGTGDNLDLREVLSSQRLQRINSALGSYDLIFIDEAQRIPEIGYSIKLLIDISPGKTIVLSGSSSFELSGQLGEPLTGRQKQKKLFPLSVMELHEQFGGMRVLEILDELLIFGSYPEVLNQDIEIDKTEYLHLLRDSYLLKDILELENLKYSDKLFDLLKLLAFQIGHEVSLNELANKLGIAKQSVERYISLLEKAFVVKRLGGFSRNLRNEITKSSRYYFLDNGVRNAIINNFNPIGSRNDIGMLWENFMVMERLKNQEYKRMFSNNYFWRTYDQKEIDLIEDRGGKLYAFEFKYGSTKTKAPKQWQNAYPDSEFSLVTPENFLDFLI
ncbi:MAG: ATP-binding protein [Bacteroidales bacterium]|nr:ATP-binding protein [Bacteroidales bacterium]